MNGFDVLQILVTLGVLVVASPFIGRWIYRIVEKPQSSSESVFYRIVGLDAK